MGKWTPGPWEARDDMWEDIDIMRAGTGRIIASVDAAFEDPIGAEQIANARLIAAAPDLLAACEAIHFFVVEDITDEDGNVVEDRDDVCITPQYFDAIMAVRAAIAKATGGEA